MMKEQDIMRLPEVSSQASDPKKEPEAGTSTDDSTPDISAMLDERMSELPDNQKKFVLEYLTPETVGLLGVILGQEAIDYFAPFVDPSKMAVIQPRPQESMPAQAVPAQPASAAPAAPSGPQAGILAQGATPPQQGPILPVAH